MLWRENVPDAFFNILISKQFFNQTKINRLDYWGSHGSLDTNIDQIDYVVFLMSYVSFDIKWHLMSYDAYDIKNMTKFNLADIGV